MKLYFVLLIKSHLLSYPCPIIINYLWNIGFLLGITIILQIITGIFLGLHYTSDLNSAYFSIFQIIREIYYGWCLRYLHSSGASFVFLFIFLHLGRAIFYVSYFYNTNIWFSGILLFFFLMGIAFIGYVLPFGQMSFWDATVITNLLSPFPSLIEFVCGGYYVYNPTLKRFFVFHFLFPFLKLSFVILHIFNLHFLSSNNPLSWGTNNKIKPYPPLPSSYCRWQKKGRDVSYDFIFFSCPSHKQDEREEKRVWLGNNRLQQAHHQVLHSKVLLGCCWRT